MASRASKVPRPTNISNYEQGKYCATRRSRNSPASQSISNASLVPARQVMLPRENKVSQRRKELSESLQRKWSLEDELNYQYYSQCNDRVRKTERPVSCSPSGTRSRSITNMEAQQKGKSSGNHPHRSLSVSHTRAMKNEAVENALVYVTPLQRKDKHIRDLQIELREKEIALELLEEELNRVLAEKSPDVRALLEQKNAEIQTLNATLQESSQRFAELEFKHEETTQNIALYQRSVEDLKKERDIKEKQSQDMYMQMYKKGQMASQMEKQEQLNEMARIGTEVEQANAELQERLAAASREIARLKSASTRASDSEQMGESEATATLQFLRTSLFHYLTRDPREAGRHLKAMIGMMSFSEEQLEKIAKAVESKRRKTVAK